MRKTRAFRLSVGICLWLLSSAPAQTDIMWNHTLSSKYVFRGVNIVNNWAYQPGASLELGNLTVSLWGNMDLTDHNGSVYNRRKPAGTFTEWDLGVEYSSVWKGLQMAVGCADYQYPGTGWERTREAYLSLSIDSPLSTSLTVYRDMGAAKGTYITAGVEVPLYRGFHINAQAGYGCPRFNSYYYGSDAASWVDLTLGIGTTIDVRKGWQLKPTLWFSTLLDKRLLTGQPNRQNVWFSVEVCRVK